MYERVLFQSVLLSLYCSCFLRITDGSIRSLCDYKGVVPDENLMVDCSNYVLSWAGYQFEYYALDFSCNSSSISTVTSVARYADSIRVNLSRSALPTPGQTCEYFGCVKEGWTFHFFSTVTCTGSSEETVAATTFHEHIMPTTIDQVQLTAVNPTSQEQLAVMTTGQLTVVEQLTAIGPGQELIKASVTVHGTTTYPPTLLTTVAPVMGSNEVPTYSISSVGLQNHMSVLTSTKIGGGIPVDAVLNNPSLLQVLVLPLMVVIFAAFIIFLVLILAIRCCSVKQRAKDHNQRKKMGLSLLPSDSVFPMDGFVHSTLPPKMAYSLSEQSIHTLLEHLKVDATPSVDKELSSLAHKLEPVSSIAGVLQPTQSNEIEQESLDFDCAADEEYVFSMSKSSHFGVRTDMKMQSCNVELGPGPGAGSKSTSRDCDERGTSRDCDECGTCSVMLGQENTEELEMDCSGGSYIIVGNSESSCTCDSCCGNTGNVADEDKLEGVALVGGSEKYCADPNRDSGFISVTSKQ